MKAKLHQLERLRRLRAAKERLSEAAVASAAGRLREVEGSLALAGATKAANGMEAARALEAGEVEAWRASLALMAADGRDVARSKVACEGRLDELRAAEKALDACRIATEQARMLHRGVDEALRVAEARSAQTASDDRFLARRQWKRLSGM